jgi:hypothetical protein
VTPARCRIVRVVLRYRREPGTTRIEGYIVLRKVDLKRQTICSENFQDSPPLKDCGVS